MGDRPILEDVGGATHCTGCPPEADEACEGTRVEARALPCDKEPA